MIRRSFSLSNVSIKQHRRPSFKTRPEHNDTHPYASHRSTPHNFSPMPRLQIPKIKHWSKRNFHEWKIDEWHENMFTISFFNIDHNVEIKHCLSQKPKHGDETYENRPYRHQIKHVVQSLGPVVSSSQILVINSFPFKEIPRENVPY